MLQPLIGLNTSQQLYHAFLEALATFTIISSVLLRALCCQPLSPREEAWQRKLIDCICTCPLLPCIFQRCTCPSSNHSQPLYMCPGSHPHLPEQGVLPWIPSPSQIFNLFLTAGFFPSSLKYMLESSITMSKKQNFP